MRFAVEGAVALGWSEMAVGVLKGGNWLPGRERRGVDDLDGTVLIGTLGCTFASAEFGIGKSDG